MNFTEIAQKRQSCRNYDSEREVEQHKLEAILETARIAPSACNGQPYRITVCRGEAARRVARATQGMGMNKFAKDAPVMLVISERPYVKTAAIGAKQCIIGYLFSAFFAKHSILLSLGFGLSYHRFSGLSSLLSVFTEFA